MPVSLTCSKNTKVNNYNTWVLNKVNDRLGDNQILTPAIHVNIMCRCTIRRIIICWYSMFSVPGSRSPTLPFPDIPDTKLNDVGFTYNNQVKSALQMLKSLRPLTSCTVHIDVGFRFSLSLYTLATTITVRDAIHHSSTILLSCRQHQHPCDYLPHKQVAWWAGELSLLSVSTY